VISASARRNSVRPDLVIPGLAALPAAIERLES
jgi:hypothetical protein